MTLRPASGGPSAASTVVVFRTGHLGDTLVSLPAFKAIRDAHRDARLILLTDRHGGRTVMSWEVARPTGLFDGVELLDVPGRIRGYVAAARAIRALQPARLYYLPPMPRTRRQTLRDWLFFRLLCGIGDIVGLRPTGRYPVRTGSGALVRMAPEAERLLAWIAPAAAGSGRPVDGRIVPSSDHRAVAAGLIDSAGLRGRQLIAVAPGSNMQAKRWPEERFAAAGRTLLGHCADARLVLIGGPDEHALCERLRSGWGPKAINLTGLGIWETAALLEQCAAYLGNDTGLMHLAASVGTTCVAIFSARDNPGKWEPMGRGHVVLRHEVECGGCGLATCVERDVACLRRIEVEEVVAAAIGLLHREAARA